MELLKRTGILMVGSGGNAIGCAALLQKRGVENFVIISKQSDFGGVWHQNRYPGCALDDIIIGYQFGFALSAHWGGTHARHDEIAAYMQKVAADLGLYEKTHFNTEMLQAEWNEAECAWKVDTDKGYYLADFLMPVTGFLEEPVITHIPGMETFDGRIFHSSDWPEDYDGAGDRIAVVGTGSSSLQIVPALQGIAEKLTVFQRTANHILPLNKRSYSDEERAEWQSDPERMKREQDEFLAGRDEIWKSVILAPADETVAELEGVAMSHLDQVVDPVLRAKLTPTHAFGCKRMGASDDFYHAVQQSNVELVAEAAGAIEPGAILSASGERFDVDAIVLATGFVFGGSILHRIRRRDGTTVGEYQQGRPRAYKSVSVAGCPNLFLVGGAGPNGMTWRGVSAGELVATYFLECVDYMRKTFVRAIEVKEECELAWKRRADEILASGPTVSGGCVSYWQDEQGANKAAWPGSLRSMEEAMSAFDPDAYLVVAPGDLSDLAKAEHRLAGEPATLS